MGGSEGVGEGERERERGGERGRETRPQCLCNVEVTHDKNATDIIFPLN